MSAKVRHRNRIAVAGQGLGRRRVAAAMLDKAVNQQNLGPRGSPTGSQRRSKSRRPSRAGKKSSGHSLWNSRMIAQAASAVSAKLKELQVVVSNHALVGEKREVDGPVPILPADQDYGDVLHAAGLTKREHFEHFVERAETAGKNDQGHRPQHEVELADGKIAELETEFGRDVRDSALAPWAGRCSARPTWRRCRARRDWRLP